MWLLSHVEAGARGEEGIGDPVGEEKELNVITQVTYVCVTLCYVLKQSLIVLLSGRHWVRCAGLAWAGLCHMVIAAELSEISPAEGEARGPPPLCVWRCLLLEQPG